MSVTADDADAEAEEVLNDLNRLVEGEDANMNLNDSQRQQDGDWNQHGELNFADGTSNRSTVKTIIPQALSLQFHER